EPDGWRREREPLYRGAAAQLTGREREPMEGSAAVVGAPRRAAAADDHGVGVDGVDRGEVVDDPGGDAAPGRALVVGAQERAEGAGRVAAPAGEVDRPDRVALRERVAPVPAG